MGMMEIMVFIKAAWDDYGQPMIWLKKMSNDEEYAMLLLCTQMKAAILY